MTKLVNIGDIEGFGQRGKLQQSEHRAGRRWP